MIAFASFLFVLPSLHDAGSASEAEPPQAANVLTIYDLENVLPRFDKETKWSDRLVVSSADPWGHLPRFSPSLRTQEGSPEVLVDVLTQLVGDDLRFEGRRVGLQDQARLAVLAPEEVHARVREALTFLQERLNAQVEISVDVLTVEGGSPTESIPGGIYDPVEADHLINTYLGRGAEQRRFTARLGAGRTTAIDDVRGTSFVWDYDVEIAQGALIFDPIVLAAETGAHLLLRGVPINGGTYLSVLYRDSSLVEEIRDREASLKGAVSKEDGGYRSVSGPDILHDAAVLFRSAAFDTFLPDGQVLVFASEADLPGAQSSQIVVLRRAAGDLVSHAAGSFGGSPSLLLLNTEFLSPPRFEIGPSPWVESDWIHYYKHVHPYLIGTLRAEPSLFLFDWMKSRFSTWRRLGPWALAVTSPDWDSSSADELAQLVQGARHHTDVTTVVLNLQGAGRSPARLSLPVRVGTSAAAACGITSHVLLDYDVEVAQFASVGDPIRPPVLDGMAAGLRTASSPEGVDVELRVIANRRTQPIQAISLKDEYNLGLLDLVDVLGLAVEDRLSLKPGGFPVVLGDEEGREGPAAFHVQAAVY